MSNDPAFDLDNPEWTREDFARAKPASALPPHILAAFPNTGRHRSGGEADILFPAAAAIAAQGAGARIALLEA